MNDAAKPSEDLVKILGVLAEGGNLKTEQTQAAMSILLSGEASPTQIGAFLMGLRVKGETVEEISGLVTAMRAASLKVTPQRDDLVDLCGTGGDGSGSFNISTAASLVVAGAGCGVAKHGNRSASSLCGSADVLEALGVPIDLDAEGAAKAIDEHGFAFLFARTYHPAMRFVGGPRSELRFRTVFNILGPMTNPATVRRQLIGVYHDGLRDTMANVLKSLGSEKVWVVHGHGGLDELSISGPTKITALHSGQMHVFSITPEDAGLQSHKLSELVGGDASVNARILQEVLGGKKGAHRDAVLLNAGAAIVVAGAEKEITAGVGRAAESIDSGAALACLDRARGR
ncbi:MAG: anthranilate phosphoribosyltransferase [Planctomycetota bacterium]